MLLVASSCFHTTSPSDLKCATKAGCPAGYVCSSGRCLLNAGPVPPDGGGVATVVDSSIDSPIDSTVRDEDGGNSTMDSAGTDGTSALLDASIADLPAGGSDPSSTDGGMMSPSDAPIEVWGLDLAPPLDLGSNCSSASQCASGYCADGACCDSKCDGICESCGTGRCSASASPRTACRGSGKCSGYCDPLDTKSCTFPKTSTLCKEATCSMGSYTPESYCDGLGNCSAALAQSCDSDLCASDGKSCVGGCTTTSCSPGAFCDGTRCVTKKTSGACSGDVQCISGYCVDGVCCDAHCDGQCESCSTGTCNVSAFPRTPCGGTGKCAGTCVAINRKACTFPDISTTCLDANCSSKVYQAAGSCDGSGGCSVPQTRTCSFVCSSSQGCIGVCNLNDKQCSAGVPQQCDATGQWQNLTACSGGKACSGAGNCACPQGTQTCGSACCTSGQFCDTGTGTCQSTKPDGQPCTSNVVCTSAICTPFYVDTDLDTFGTGAAVNLCGSSPPNGYAARAGDCCDSNGTINPGITDYYAQQTACNGTFTWDYDCSGTGDKRREANVGATCVYDSATTTCVYVGATGGYPSSDCGQSYSIPSMCSQISPGTCNFMGGGVGGTVICR